MLLRKVCPAALGLCIGVGGGMSRGQEGPRDAQLPIPTVAEPGHLALEPGSAKITSEQSQNQRMADAIAERLHASGRLHGYRVDIRFEAGVAELTGRVADAAQRAEVAGMVRGMSGVRQVNDLLDMESGKVLLTAQGGEFQAPQPSLLDPQPSVGGPTMSGPLAPGQMLQAAGIWRADGAGAGVDHAGHGRLQSGDAEPVDAATAAASLRLADVRALQQLFARRPADALSIRGVSVHRADVSVSQGAVGMASRDATLAGWALVLWQNGDGT